MTQRIFTDRSRIETAQHCLRERFLRYHQDGTGLESAKKALPLAVGGAVHKGLEVLLREGQVAWTLSTTTSEQTIDGKSYFMGVDLSRDYWLDIEQHAVEAAIADLSQYRNSLALDSTEAAAQATAIAIPDDVMRQQLADSLGLSVEDAGLDSLLTTQASGKAGFDDYLWKEQSALVEGMVRAYARRRLRPLLEEFEVLEVEREGTWELAAWDTKHQWETTLAGIGCKNCGTEPPEKYEDTGYCSQGSMEITFCSRPDALLRSRSDNSLYLMSFKTAATWDRRKELDAQHDMQGLSEGVEVERRLSQWYNEIQKYDPSLEAWAEASGTTIGMAKYLATIGAPPRILGIRYEYILKNYRGEDKELSARFGFKCWSQRSHLVRRYRAVSLPQKGQSAFNLGDYCWSFDFLKEDGGESKLYYGHWKSEPVDNVKQWIDKLDDTQEAMSAFDSTVGQEPRAMGWKSAGQALGFTKEHPLDAIFITPIVVYRQDDDLRDFMEEIEEQEVDIAENVAQIEATSDEGERRTLLNRKFRKTRKACSYPSECIFTKLCFGGEDIRSAPLESGIFVRRIPNHVAEKEASLKEV